MDKRREEYIEECKKGITQALSTNHILIHYIRDFRGNRKGCLVAAILDEDETPSYGWSVCHPKKDTFNKYIGLTKAMQRMVLGSPAADNGALLLPSSVVEALPEFEKRVKRYFKVADETEEEAGLTT